MSNGDLFNLMDVTMQQLLETFPNPRKPGADENPPRNFRCGGCGQWLPTSAFPERMCMCAHAAHLEMPCICGAGGHQCGGTP